MMDQKIDLWFLIKEYKYKIIKEPVKDLSLLLFLLFDLLLIFIKCASKLQLMRIRDSIRRNSCYLIGYSLTS